ncbi:MAG: methyltransferase domain-containing protein [Deltaproteobacteria bacterium]|nr:methyltransferase domain-containing protein [Deltaproteobacteria bacterium]
MEPFKAETLIKLANSFMTCRILLSAAEMDLFTLLAGAPLTAREAAKQSGADPRALKVLLDALAALKFLTKENETYQCRQPLAPLLSTGSPGSVLPMILHYNDLWGRWSRLTDTVMGTETPSKPDAPSRTIDELRAFIGAMNVVAAPRAKWIIEALNPGAARSLIDVGGASGTYTIAFLRAVPALKATLFDLPEVVEIARDRLKAEGLMERVTLVGGDFYRDELPTGHDLALLSAIIHQNSRQQNRALFAKVFRSLAAGGRVVIRDHVMSPDRTSPPEGAVFAVNMLVGTTGGGTYTLREIEEDLGQAGFEKARLLREGAHMDALVEAFKPS